MWEKLKHKVWQWRGVFVVVPCVTVAVVGLRASGLLQPPEFLVLDHFFILRPAEPVDPRIAIVEINEADVRKYQFPIPDANLAKLLETIKQQKPAGIGLDIYRDLPVEPGHQDLVRVFETTPNLIGVQKVVESSDSSSVAPSPVLKQKDQVGSNDFLLDLDGKVRRLPIYLADNNRQQIFSFGFVLAANYLQQKKGIQPELTRDNLVKLGPAVFPGFQSNDGAYVRAAAEGYLVLLNYRGPIQRFKTMTMTEVMENRIPADAFRDRIVLIGATAESLKDLFYVPYSSNFSNFTHPTRTAGVVIHANFISQTLGAVLDQRPLLRVWDKSLEGLWLIAWTMIGAFLIWQQRYVKRWIFASALSVLVAAGALTGICFLAFLQGWWLPLVPPLLGLTWSAIAIIVYVAQSASVMRRTFGRYLTDEVVASLLETPTGLTLGGERRKVTILMSDIRGFSAISEQLPPEKVVTILNLYLGAMADIISYYRGNINEFIGDGIVVMFGAPVYQDDDSQRAIACAIAMQSAMQEVNRQNQQMGLPAIEMGIGINTGEVVVGNIGSQRRAKYTVIGNHVNLAARIESYTVGRQILISENTFQDAGPIVKVSGHMQVEPKGIREPITLYEINGISGNYNIYLLEDIEEFTILQHEIPIRYTVLEGKHLVGTIFTGVLVRVSAIGAELRSDEFLTPLSNLKITLLSPENGSPTIEDLYAKVLGKPAESLGCYRLRFTSVLPKGGTVLEQLLHTPKTKASDN